MIKVKVLLASALIGLGTIGAQAAMNVTVTGLGGFYQEDDTLGLLETSPHGWLQIIRVLNGAPTQAGPGGTIGGNEQLITSFGLTDGVNSDTYGSFAYDLVAPFVLDSSWYVRIFTGGSSTTGAAGDNIVAGMWYYESALYTAIDNNTPETPDLQSVQGNNPTVNNVEFGGDFLNRQVVPEPTTLAFLGVGGLVLALRRRFVA